MSDDAWYTRAHTAVSAAIGDLGYLKGKDFDLATVAEQIVSLAHDGEWLKHPRNRSASQSIAKREIDQLNELAVQMRHLINSVHGPTHDKIQASDIKVEDIDSFCSKLIFICRGIDLSDLPLRTPRSKTRFAEQQIALRLSELYESETGRTASATWNAYTHTTSGDFVKLVEGVFRALGKRNSAASCVKYVMEQSRRAGAHKEK